jgi:hypothetical protein
MDDDGSPAEEIRQIICFIASRSSTRYIFGHREAFLSPARATCLLQG